MGPYDEQQASEEKMRGIWEGRLSHLDSIAFSLAAVFVRYLNMGAWNRLVFATTKTEPSACVT